MGIAVRIPTTLRNITGGHAEVRADGTTVAELLASVDAQYPGIRHKVVDTDGHIWRYMTLFVGTEDVRFTGGLETPVAAGDTLSIVPAVAGG